MKKLTPIEQFEYKIKWMKQNSRPVRIHSDLRRQGKEWCGVQLMPHQWKIETFTDVYEDTYYFEHHQDQNQFAFYFKKWLTS